MYPKNFTEQNKKDFDEIKRIAETIPEYVALIFDGTSHIIIEIAAEKVTPFMWDAIHEFNASAKSLSIGYAYVSENIQGERYV